MSGSCPSFAAGSRAAQGCRVSSPLHHGRPHDQGEAPAAGLPEHGKKPQATESGPPAALRSR
eukprot:15480528-Alexandrium_andersonii.AAC.1